MRKTSRPSMLDTLLSRLRGKAAAPEPVAKSPPRPYQAIAIFRGTVACDMAKRFSEHRFLARDAPPLPLEGCSMRGTCQCRYLKFKDRRGTDRRLVDFGVASNLFSGRERRGLRGRRKGER